MLTAVLGKVSKCMQDYTLIRVCGINLELRYIKSWKVKKVKQVQGISVETTKTLSLDQIQDYSDLLLILPPDS